MPTGYRWLIAGIRILLLTLAAGAVGAAAILAPIREDARAGPDGRYRCPMHPEITDGTASPCPICGMALEPLSPAQAAGHERTRALENLRQHDIFDFAAVRSIPSNLPASRGSAWVEDDGAISAVFYNHQLEWLPEAEPASFTPAATPKVRIPVRRTSDGPTLWDRSTSRIRFRLHPAKGPAKGDSLPAPGRVGWVELARKPGDALMIPSSAILRSPEGPYVLFAGPDFRFEKRPIEVGETFAGLKLTVVQAGLQAEERIVAHAAFFLDAERRQNEKLEKQEAVR